MASRLGPPAGGLCRVHGSWRGATIYGRHRVPATPAPASWPSPAVLRMVYSEQLQATHCAGTPSWTGRWFSPRGDPWFRVWACPDHLDGLTGLREFGRRRAKKQDRRRAGRAWSGASSRPCRRYRLAPSEAITRPA